MRLIKMKSFTIFFSILLILVILFYFFHSHLLGANSNEKVLSQQSLKVNINGEEQELMLQQLEAEGSSKKFQLILKTKFSNEKINLPGFEDRATFCEKRLYQLSTNPQKNALCLVGDVGAHSQNVVFINIENKKLSYVPFLIDNQVLTSISSDSPSIIARQSGGGTLEVLVDNRDYDTDPLSQIIRTTYKWNGLGFVFDRTQNIQYDKIN